MVGFLSQKGGRMTRTIPAKLFFFTADAVHYKKRHIYTRAPRSFTVQKALGSKKHVVFGRRLVSFIKRAES